MNSENYGLQGAQRFSSIGKLEEWVHEFLVGEGNNIEFSKGLKLNYRQYYGPVKMKLDLFERCCGPEETMMYRVAEEPFEENIRMMVKDIEAGWDIPPLIVNYVDKKFVINDGNHRFEALKRTGVNEYYIVLWTTEASEMDDFLESFSKYFGNNL